MGVDDGGTLLSSPGSRSTVNHASSDPKAIYMSSYQASHISSTSLPIWPSADDQKACIMHTIIHHKVYILSLRSHHPTRFLSRWPASYSDSGQQIAQWANFSDKRDLGIREKSAGSRSIHTFSFTFPLLGWSPLLFSAWHRWLSGPEPLECQATHIASS